MTTASLLTLPNLLIVSALVRGALIVYSEWHDARSALKYTDVDYRVFSDATRFLLNLGGENVAQGPLGRLLQIGDPYTRETYRYTPLLAALLASNEWLHPAFGKCLFAACDLLAGVIIYDLLVDYILPEAAAARRGSLAKGQDASTPAGPSEGPALTAVTATPTSGLGTSQRATLLTAAHLLNPMVFAISTRGSSESVLLLLVLLALSAARARQWDAAALLVGAGAHWKIYPAVYGVACVRALMGPRGGVAGVFSTRAGRFFGLAAGTFAVLGGVMYAIWGYPFLYESYLYHIHRRDHRHNFAPHFYALYLSYPSTNGTAVGSEIDTSLSLWTSVLRSPLASFVPQMATAVGAGWLFGARVEDLPFAWFVQTFAFVVFNKVCTSQYFLWYLVLVPLLIPRLQRALTLPRAVALVGVWAGTQALWLAAAYRLEFLSENVFLGLWVRGLIYVAGHCWVLGEIVRAYAT